MEGERIESLLTALLVLATEQREREMGRSGNERKIELVLADAGLDPRQIAQVLNKNYDAVRKAISRGRAESD
jgi:DNA-directed RNA polymerase specialized sigma24 family protein